MRRILKKNPFSFNSAAMAALIGITTDGLQWYPNINGDSGIPDFQIVDGFAHLDGINDVIKIIDADQISATTMGSGFRLFGSFSRNDAGTILPLFWKNGEYLFYLRADNRLAGYIFDGSNYIGRIMDNPISDEVEFTFAMMEFNGSDIILRKIENGFNDTLSTADNSGVFISMSRTSNDLLLGFYNSNYAAADLIGFGIITEDFINSGFSSLISNVLFPMAIALFSQGYGYSIVDYINYYFSLAYYFPTTTGLWLPLQNDFSDSTGLNTIILQG